MDRAIDGRAVRQRRPWTRQSEFGIRGRQEGEGKAVSIAHNGIVLRSRKSRSSRRDSLDAWWPEVGPLSQVGQGALDVSTLVS